MKVCYINLDDIIAVPDAISQNTVVLPRERTRNSDQVTFIFTVYICVCVCVC